MTAVHAILLVLFMALFMVIMFYFQIYDFVSMVYLGAAGYAVHKVWLERPMVRSAKSIKRGMQDFLQVSIVVCMFVV